MTLFGQAGIGKAMMIALGWAMTATASAAVSLFFLRDFMAGSRTAELLAILFAGAVIGYFAGRGLLSFLPESWKPTRRFAAAFILIGAATIGVTAFLFALQFRAYFAQWHDTEWSKRYVLETVFTMLSAIYQFLVLGLRLYLPLGLIGLIALSWKFAQRRI